MLFRFVIHNVDVLIDLKSYDFINSSSVEVVYFTVEFCYEFINNIHLILLDVEFFLLFVPLNSDNLIHERIDGLFCDIRFLNSFDFVLHVHDFSWLRLGSIPLGDYHNTQILLISNN